MSSSVPATASSSFLTPLQRIRSDPSCASDEHHAMNEDSMRSDCHSGRETDSTTLRTSVDRANVCHVRSQTHERQDSQTGCSAATHRPMSTRKEALSLIIALSDDAHTETELPQPLTPAAAIMAEPIAAASDDQREEEDEQWSTVKSATAEAHRIDGRSGGRRNGKAKYQSHSGARRAAPGRQGPPINMQQKRADVAAESAWFSALPAASRSVLLSTLTAVMHRHIAEMAATPFLEQIVAQINRARAAIGCGEAAAALDVSASSAAAAIASAAAVAAASSVPAVSATAAAPAPLEIVIYGIGRFAEYAPPLASAVPAAASLSSDQLTPQQVRSSIRASSRPPQLQLAAILAVAQRLCGWTAQTIGEGDAAASAASSSAVSSSASSLSPLLHMYDPMLSSLECALAAQLGVRIIPRNEEGHRSAAPASVAQATLFYMPHCPQTLSDNVLAANWGGALSRVLIIGNSLSRYAEQAAARARADAAADEAAASSGYLRGPRTRDQSSSHSHSSRGKKKASSMAAILAASPVCCDHDHAPSLPTLAASSSSDAAAASPSSVGSSPAASSPYPHLTAISPWLSEAALSNSHASRTVFNDLSLHWFAISPPILAALSLIESGRGDEVDEGTRRRCSALLQRPVVSARSMPVAGSALDAEIISAAMTDARR